MTDALPGAVAWEDLDDFFQEYRTAVTLASGDVIDGMYQAVSAEGGELGGPILILKQADVNEYTITYGDTVTVDGEAKIVAALRPDGYGTVTVLLDVQ